MAATTKKRKLDKHRKPEAPKEYIVERLIKFRERVENVNLTCCVIIQSNIQ